MTTDNPALLIFRRLTRARQQALVTAAALEGITVEEKINRRVAYVRRLVARGVIRRAAL
jgi:hypothetical protein